MITWNAYLSIYTEKQNFAEEHNTGASLLLLLFNENIYWEFTMGHELS